MNFIHGRVIITAEADLFQEDGIDHVVPTRGYFHFPA